MWGQTCMVLKIFHGSMFLCGQLDGELQTIRDACHRLESKLRAKY